MEVIKLKTYKLSELSDAAKEKAFNNSVSNFTYHWHDENIAVLKEFENIFPLQINNYEYDQNNGFVSWEFAYDDVQELSGIRLMAKLSSNYFRDLYKGKYYSLWSKKDKNPHYTEGGSAPCGKLKSKHSKILFEETTLTGYCVGYDILKPIFDFLKKPTDITFEDLMQECIDAWIKSVVFDYEYAASMEAFTEDAEVNEWKYTEDGEYYC